VRQLAALNGRKNPSRRDSLSPSDRDLLAKVVTGESKAHHREFGYRID